MSVVELHADHQAPLALPPTDVDAEAAVIGAALLSARVIEPVRVDEGLTADRFYRDRHRHIWAAIEHLADQGDTIDLLTVTGRLADQGKLDDVGGRRGLEALTAAPPSVSGARSYARRVVDAWRWRTRAGAHHRALAAIHDRDEDAHAVAAAQATDVVTRAQLDPTPAGARQRFVAALNEPQRPPLPFPWPTLGRRFRMRPGASTVVASWTSWGKSWLALELASHIGAKDCTATIWTNEMDEEELVARHVQRVTGISSDDVLDRQGDPADIATAVKQLPFGIVPAPGWPADDIARHIRHVAPDLAVVDHFHQIPGISEHKVAEHAVQTLTNAARQVGTHLVIVSQLNHQRDRDDRRPDPAIRDLKSTAALQDLPNNVLLLRRKQESDRDSGETWLSDDAILHVAKQRGAPSPLYQPVFISPPRMRVVEAMFR